MKRTAWNSTLAPGKGFKAKPTPFKKTPFKTPKKRLPKESKNPIAVQKKRIQALLRECCLVRDPGCILRSVRCGRLVGDVGVVWQADHLLSRSNAATYGDLRLVVLICRNCHAWKSLGSNLRKKEYDTLVRSILPADRVALWDLAELEAGRYKGVKVDWTAVELDLQNQLRKLSH